MKRVFYFDILRIIACFMIVFMHSQKAYMGTPAWFLSGSSYLTGAGIGIFFMLSGALHLSKCRHAENFDTVSFLKRSLFHIGVPLIFWSFFYYGLTFLGSDGSGLDVMWFLWTLSGLYLLTPILIKWLSCTTFREVSFYLLIWIVSLLLPWLNYFCDIEASEKSALYYFYGYAGYYVLGYYLANIDIAVIRRYLCEFVCAFLLCSVCFPFAVLLLRIEVDFYAFFWYLSIPMVLQSIAWFIAFRLLVHYLSPITQRLSVFISKLSTLTFGVYMTHMLILRIGLWNLPFIQNFSGIAHMLVCTLITIPAAFLLTYLLGKIPYFKWVVGIR